jgi:hypothetical protein
VRRLLGDDAAELVCRYWDITEEGNFEHHNILHPTLEVEQLAKLFRRDVGEVRRALAEARSTLLAAREQRVKPARDEKMLTAWNALMISAYARAAEVLGDDGYRDIASQGVAFVEATLQRGDRLLSTCKDGVAKLNGHLDDYAFFVTALLDVYELLQDRGYLDRAVRLADAMLAHFWDASGGGFFFTSDDHERLIVRNKPAFDGSIPSGNSVAVRALLRLYHLTGRPDFLTRAEATLRLYAGQMREQPFGFANMLCALDFFVQGPREVVVVGRAGAPDTAALLDAVRRRYVPNRTLQVIDPQQADALPAALQGKGQVDGNATAYVCHKMTCSLPATTAAEFILLLEG